MLAPFYKYRLTIFGHPVPYTRMTTRGIWRKDAQEYLGYQEHIVKELINTFPSLKMEIPPTSDKKARAEFVKAHRQCRYGIEVIVTIPRDTGDVSNYLKTVEDAIQKAKFIANDKQFHEVYAKKIIDPDVPAGGKVEFVFWRYQ